MCNATFRFDIQLLDIYTVISHLNSNYLYLRSLPFPGTNSILPRLPSLNFNTILETRLLREVLYSFLPTTSHFQSAIKILLCFTKLQIHIGSNATPHPSASGGGIGSLILTASWSEPMADFPSPQGALVPIIAHWPHTHACGPNCTLPCGGRSSSALQPPVPPSLPCRCLEFLPAHVDASDSSANPSPRSLLLWPSCVGWARHCLSRVYMCRIALGACVCVCLPHHKFGAKPYPSLYTQHIAQ